MLSPVSSCTLSNESVRDGWSVYSDVSDTDNASLDDSSCHYCQTASEQSYFEIASPLMEEIRLHRGNEVSKLLNRGEDPNGVSHHVMEKYAAFFLRFRFPGQEMEFYENFPSRNDLLNRTTLPQLSSLTVEEIKDRMWDGLAPFWCDGDFVEANLFENGQSMPSLVEASRSGSIHIFEQLRNAGADYSFWTRPQFFVPNPPTESSLSISSPIHAALQNRDIAMLKHLIGLGFDPNTMPLSNPTRCITPLMATIVYHVDFNMEAFNLLSDCPNINMEIRTPVYGVHLLHFAVAGMDIDMLKHIASYVPLKSAGTTALGHTLLHVACMPVNANNIQYQSEIIFQSIHETRHLHAMNDCYTSYLEPYQEITAGTENYQQSLVFEYLWNNGVTDVEKVDVHGNTALHYLAGSRVVNENLLLWLRNQSGVEMLWQNNRNIYGYAPEELYKADLKVARSNDAGGWKPWFAKPRAEERRKKKEVIWENLLRE